MEIAALNYLALGDSVSIDFYTGVEGGGAASQFARLIGADEFINLAHDGRTTDGVIDSLALITSEPDIVTVTAGGNDLLQLCFFRDEVKPECPAEGMSSTQTIRNLRFIIRHLSIYGCPVILNTVYDPTDGDAELAREMGIPPEFRLIYEEINEGIRTLALEYDLILSDLAVLFHGHGVRSSETWITRQIEPNLAGATAIAHHWHELYLDYWQP